MISSKIKITFVLPSLAAGGAERILSAISQNLDPTKFDPELVVIGFEKDTVYNVSDVAVTYLNKPRVLTGIRSLYKHFKTQQPTIVFSSIIHLNIIIAFISIWFPKIKFVGREASVLSEMGKYENFLLLKTQNLAVRLLYGRFDAIVCQSKDMMSDLIANFGVSKSKTVLINNPVDDSIPIKPVSKTNEPLNFISVARLSNEKGISRLLDLLATLEFPFTYTLIGNGPEKETILKQVVDLKLEAVFNHIDFTNNVHDYLSKSDVFLQGSYVDGFPNAVLESCVVGTPVIAFDAPGGISEIIENAINGYIVNSKDEFITRLNQLNQSFDFTPEHVRKVVINRFNTSKIIKEYEDLFLKLI